MDNSKAEKIKKIKNQIKKLESEIDKQEKEFMRSVELWRQKKEFLSMVTDKKFQLISSELNNVGDEVHVSLKFFRIEPKNRV